MIVVEYLCYMAAMALFKIFYNIWFGFVVLLVLSAVSRFIFKPSDNKMKQIIDDVIFALLLPIMIFSKEGATRLIKQIKEYT